MTHEFKVINAKCFVWSIQECDSTLSSESFTIQDCKCKLEFEIKSILYLKRSRLRFICNGTLQTPITMTLRVFSNSDAISLESHELINDDKEIWKHKGFPLLDDSVLTFEVIIHPDPPTEKQIESSTSNLSSKNTDEESSASKSNSHLEALSRDFSKLLDESSSCDVEVTCDGKRFNAHRIVLGARSTVFSAMLKSNMVEDKTGLVKVEDCKASIFRNFLNYLYTGTLPELSLDSAMQFYEVGDKYAVEELKRACSEFLAKNLTESNACEILVLADQHSDENFRKNIISYIVYENIPQRDKNWPNFCKTHCSLANEIMLLYIQKQCPK